MNFLKICLILYLVELAYGATCREGGHCERPRHDTSFDHPTFKSNTDKSPWYMVIGDAVIRSHIARILTGEAVTMKEDFSSLCGRTSGKLVSEKVHHGQWVGMGGKTADWRCNRTTSHLMECGFHSEGNKHEEFNTVYITKTDNKSFVLVIMCYENLHSGWFVMSSKPNLEESEKNMILNHVESLGFDRDNVVCLYNEKCPK